MVPPLTRNSGWFVLMAMLVQDVNLGRIGRAASDDQSHLASRNGRSGVAGDGLDGHRISAADVRDDHAVTRGHVKHKRLRRGGTGEGHKRGLLVGGQGGIDRKGQVGAEIIEIPTVGEMPLRAGYLR